MFFIPSYLQNSFRQGFAGDVSTFNKSNWAVESSETHFKLKNSLKTVNLSSLEKKIFEHILSTTYTFNKWRVRFSRYSIKWDKHIFVPSKHFKCLINTHPIHNYLTSVCNAHTQIYISKLYIFPTSYLPHFSLCSNRLNYCYITIYLLLSSLLALSLYLRLLTHILTNKIQ